MLRLAKRLVLLVLLLGIVAIVGIYMLVRSSLPLYDGQQALAGLDAPVSIQRDALGVVTVTANNRLDAARATGYVHAQERFFQMDLIRRQVSGRLSELFGPVALDLDRSMRLHDFTRHAQARVDAMADTSQGRLIEAYTQGVNAGLLELTSKPFEYWLISKTPELWQAKDSVMVNFAMALTLTKEHAPMEQLNSLFHDQLPASVADYLVVQGSRWDAPLAGDVFEQPEVPSADVWQMKQMPQLAKVDLGDDGTVLGSNNWAVAGSRTQHGGALVADDMHLALRVPNIWFRLQLNYADEQGQQQQITGVSLAGAPLMVAGSNGKVAWGFTNSYGDWVDLIQLEYANDSKTHYKTDNGPQAFSKRMVVITDSSGKQHESVQLESIYGPVLKHDPQGRPLALRWTQYYPQGTNLGLVDMETATSLEQAMAVANTSGMPPQNIVIADDIGNIAWTIAGAIATRDYDGQKLVPWQQAGTAFKGWLAPEQYPRVINPPSAQIQTANARVVSGADLAMLGDGRYALGIRQRQIRDHLAGLSDVTEADMLAVQLDDEAQFYSEWKQVLETAISASSQSQMHELTDVLADWDGHASIHSVAYRLVREFRLQVRNRVWAPLDAWVKQQDEDLSIMDLGQLDGPLWDLVQKQPLNWLNPTYSSWQALLDDAALGAQATLIEQAGSLEQATWGDYNRALIQHPISRAVPQLSWLLDMPRDPLSGDRFMPKVSDRSHGASERFAVSPGKEELGYFHMPGGQSGHPLSPYYGAGHDLWQKGQTSPFLPGPAETTLLLLNQ